MLPRSTLQPCLRILRVHFLEQKHQHEGSLSSTQSHTPIIIDVRLMGTIPASTSFAFWSYTSAANKGMYRPAVGPEYDVVGVRVVPALEEVEEQVARFDVNVARV